MYFAFSDDVWASYEGTKSASKFWGDYEYLWASINMPKDDMPECLAVTLDSEGNAWAFVILPEEITGVDESNAVFARKIARHTAEEIWVEIGRMLS